MDAEPSRVEDPEDGVGERPHALGGFSSGFLPEETEREERFDPVRFLPKPYRMPDLLDVVSRAMHLGDGLLGRTTGGTQPLADATLPGIETLNRAGLSMDAGVTVLDQPPLTDRLDACGD